MRAFFLTSNPISQLTKYNKKTEKTQRKKLGVGIQPDRAFGRMIPPLLEKRERPGNNPESIADVDDTADQCDVSHHLEPSDPRVPKPEKLRFFVCNSPCQSFPIHLQPLQLVFQRDVHNHLLSFVLISKDQPCH